MTLRQRLVAALMAEGYDEAGAQDVAALVLPVVRAHFAGDGAALDRIGEDVPAPRAPAPATGEGEPAL